jgi:hypothetical protein
MACEELGIDEAAEAATADLDAAAKDALIDRFLAPPPSVEEGGEIRPYSHRDAARHSYNLSKMHSELTIRGKLHTELLQAKKEKSVLLQDLASKKKFLASIPQHVAKIEKALNGCKEYFRKDSDVIMENAVGLRLSMGAGGLNEDEEKDGKGEDVLLQLSAPLYTLHVQFVSLIQGSYGTLYNCDGWKVKIVESKPWANEGDHDSNDTGNSGNNDDDDDDDEGMVESGQEQPKERDAKCSQTNLDPLFGLQKESKAVQLCIPVGTVDGVERKNFVKIQFEYVPKFNVVLAHVVRDKSLNCIWSGSGGTSSGGGARDGLLLLQNLFPDDDGRDLPPGSASRAIYHSEFLTEFGNMDKSTKQHSISVEENDINVDDDYEEANNKEENMISAEQMAIWKMRQLFYTNCQYGRPYRWCQYLAGLHYPKPSSSMTAIPQDLLAQCQIEVTTRVVLQTLHRRIRSHFVLWQLMKKLKSLPNPIPVHPSMSGNIQQNNTVENVSAKLTNFQLVQASASSAVPCDCKVYSVVLKRKSKSLKAQVKVSARYPVEPPLWSLQEATCKDINEKGTKKQKMSPLVGTAMDDSLSLYDSSLGRIECHLNTLADRNAYFNDKEEDSYNWILMHQVRRLILEWDTLQKSLEMETL